MTALATISHKGDPAVATSPGTSFNGAAYQCIVIAPREMNNLVPTIEPGDDLYISATDNPRPGMLGLGKAGAMRNGIYIITSGRAFFALRVAIHPTDGARWFHDEQCSRSAIEWLAERSLKHGIHIVGRVVARGRNL